jgi:two-component system response regulator GlrR
MRIMHSHAPSYRAPPPTPPQRESPRPRVVLILAQGTSTHAERLIDALNAVFRCSVYTSASFPILDQIEGAELAIWELAGESARQMRTDMAHPLVDLSDVCPILVIAKSVEMIAFDHVGGHVADFVVRPFACEELVLRATRVLGLAPGTAGGPVCSDDDKLKAIIVGNSAALTKEVDKLRRFAACDAGILILGETGTGKEVFAQAVHYLSARAANPMVAINCGAVPGELMEAELFGHVKGAYTNAHISRTGLVSDAEGGTLFLDDIDCLTLSAQAKLLRFLQEREYRVVGSNGVRHADVRVIGASNSDLAEMVRQGSFRQDLYYRLNVLTLSLPPLRERRQDVGALAHHFLLQFAQRHGRPVCQLAPDGLLKLVSHDWPGNVRELGNVLERALLLAPGSTLDATDIDLPSATGEATPTESFRVTKARMVQNFERSYIENVLSISKGNIADAARIAGKNRRALFELIRKHQINPASFKAIAGQ